MSKFFMLFALMALVSQSYGLESRSQEFLQTTEKTSLKPSDSDETITDHADEVDHANIFGLIQSDGDGLNDEISTETNLPDDTDAGDAIDLLIYDEVSDQSLSNGQASQVVDSEGPLLYG
ncbi:hypothetical protein SteCoe_29288 [Stentor coeruleus]|uniref:RxLR effector protein n=1 Tax=Stentor coeruleus TaxID=5963 RepID=A0A1R2B683_9CILI|nr:hypothetical protein SteCoe_29288 [Stentor coeruleus]